MQRVPLSSRTLASAGYDPEQCHLELEFRSGKRYRYFLVPRPCYEELLQAESKGGYFNRKIRNRFAYQDLSAPSTPVVLTASKN